MNKQYSHIKFIGGVCALASGGMGIAFGLRGELMFLLLGMVSLALGVSIFYGMSKK